VSAGLTGVADVVIPAHNEEAGMAACLLSLLAQRGAVDINVVVVANGCTDRTVEIAEGLRDAARAAGHRLSVLELEEAGKARALNAADRLFRGDIHVYLDADIVLSSGALAALHRALADRPEPLMASPLPIPLLPAGHLARGYAEVWMQLPSVASQVVGLGCYAVNRAGRERWSEMPELVADDAFVRARFSEHERRLLADECFIYEFPSGRDLLGVLARWREGNRELARLSTRDDPSVRLRGALATFAARPRLWRWLPSFALVSAAVRLRRGRSETWFHARRAAGGARAAPPRLWVGVAARGLPVEERLLASLEETLTGVEHTVALLEGSSTVPPRELDGRELLLILEADAPLDTRGLELLLLVARRFPQAGVYAAGERPGTGARGVPAAWSGAAEPPSIRDARIASGSLLLIGPAAWAALDERREAILLAHERPALLRLARRRGFRPLQLPAGQPRRLGEQARSTPPSTHSSP
jgi:glycosyltransferase involved in cell wall biosynthesis